MGSWSQKSCVTAGSVVGELYGIDCIAPKQKGLSVMKTKPKTGAKKVQLDCVCLNFNLPLL